MEFLRHCYHPSLPSPWGGVDRDIEIIVAAALKPSGMRQAVPAASDDARLGRSPKKEADFEAAESIATGCLTFRRSGADAKLGNEGKKEPIDFPVRPDSSEGDTEWSGKVDRLKLQGSQFRRRLPEERV
jgi:hypothetical protein